MAAGAGWGALEGAGSTYMRRRAALVGGRLTVTSGSGRGTTVILEVPVGLRSRLFG